MYLKRTIVLNIAVSLGISITQLCNAEDKNNGEDILYSYDVIYCNPTDMSLISFNGEQVSSLYTVSNTKNVSVTYSLSVDGNFKKTVHIDPLSSCYSGPVMPGGSCSFGVSYNGGDLATFL